jgi:hypothetical protein
MPMGWDAGDFGGSVREVETEPVGFSPEERAAEARSFEAAMTTVWTRWRTVADERVCPECGPLDGLAWPDGDGPVPPLHNHCRCAREFAFVELSSRG